MGNPHFDDLRSWGRQKMLTPATASDLPFVRSVVQVGAASGAFEEELQGDSLESQLFFSNIHRVLTTGIMQVERPVSGEIAEVPAICYLLHEIANGGQNVKQGFGIFKATPISIELWLMGVAPDLRGRGIGRALIDSLMNAPQAKNCFLARACKHSVHYSTVSHLLISHRFVPSRDTGETIWFVRIDAPIAVAAAVRNAPLVKPQAAGSPFRRHKSH